MIRKAKIQSVGKFAFERQYDERTVFRRLHKAGVKPHKTHGRTKWFRVQDMKVVMKPPKVEPLADGIPNIKEEKALRARINRQEDEVRLQKTLGNIASIDVCRRIVIRAGKLALTKLMAIPDRTAERFALMSDAGAIRETLTKEIADALRNLSEQPVEELIKNVLSENE